MRFTSIRRLSATRLARLWLPMLGQTGRDLWAANALELAAALAFYAMLSLFPLLLAGAVTASALVDPAWATERVAELLGEVIPRGEVEVEAIVQEAVAERGRVGIVSIAIFLLTGRRVLGALTKALDVVSDVDEQADPLRRRALAELVLLAGLVLAAGSALLSGPLLDAAGAASGAAPGPQRTAFAAVTGILRAGLIFVTFFLVYTIIPRGRRMRRATAIGAGAATLLFLPTGAIFGVVSDRAWSTLDLVYGPLAVGIMLLVWCWYVGIITLVGAALASHVKTMLLEGQSAAETERRHAGNAGRAGRSPQPDTPTDDHPGAASSADANGATG